MFQIRSCDDNKIYKIKLPDEDKSMKEKFENTINDMRNFDIEQYHQVNGLKCRNCIYEDACDRAMNRGE